MKRVNKNSLIIIYLTLAAILIILLINIFAVDVIKLGNLETWDIPEIDNANVRIKKNLLCVDISDNENPYYIYTGEGSINNSDIYELKTDTDYYIDFIGVKTAGDVNASFWIIEYQNNNKINTTTSYFNEENGKPFRVNLNGHTDRYRIAIRLIGTGSFQIKGIKISRFNHHLLIKSILTTFITAILFFLFKKYYIQDDKFKLSSYYYFNNIITHVIYFIIMFLAFTFVFWLIFRNDSFIGTTRNFTIVLFFLMLIIGILLHCKIINIKIGNILIISIAVRLIWCFAIRTLPVSDFSTYWNIAQKVISGNISIFASKSPTVPLLYSFVLKIYNSIFSVYIFNSLIGGLQVLLIYKISQVICKDEMLPITAAILYAFYPASVMYTSVFSSETIMITCVLIAIYLAIKIAQKDNITKNNIVKTVVYSGIIGLSLGLAYMARTVSLVFLISVLLFILLFTKAKIKIKLINLCFILLFFFISLTPLLYYNYSQHKAISFSTYPASGYVLLFGTSYESNGGYNKAEIEVIMEENGLGETMENPNSYENTKIISEYATKKAIARILDQPMKFLSFAFHEKFDRLWENEKIYSFIVNGSNLYENEVDSLKMKNVFLNSYNYYSLLWVFTLFCIINSFFSKDRNIAFFSLSIIGVAILHVFFEVQPRYHLVVMPLVCILAGSGLITITKILVLEYKKVIIFIKSGINKNS